MGDIRAGRDRLAAIAGLSTFAVLGAGLAASLMISSMLPAPIGAGSGLLGRVLALIEEAAAPAALLAASLVATAVWRLGGSARSRSAVTAAAATALLVTFANARWMPTVVMSSTGQTSSYLRWLVLSVTVAVPGLLVAATTWATAPPRQEGAPAADRDRTRTPRILLPFSAATALVATGAWFSALSSGSHESTRALTNWLFAIGGGLAVGATAWAATRIVLGPVETLNRELQEITTSRAFDQRITVSEIGTLVPWLARTINVNLDRVFAGVTRQKLFIADASHELRSPIANLRTSLEASLAHPEKVDWPETVRGALTDIGRLQRLTDDLLLLARLDDTAPPAGSPVDLAALAHDLVEEFRHLRIHKTLQFTFHSDDPVVVDGSAVQLERLLRNLLDNAARHARTVTDITVTAGSDGRARVEIRDDGPGIPTADRERIFERFTRLDSARARNTGGSGLGLAIGREIAARHGGTLHAAPNPSGALLIVDLPHRP
ncbi:sensor histidine kinase [Streptomyces sp. NBC_01244]|uniref:sensor histidine kinase n=1 Tax=Streptomyces sp. NBC_01244 TaxID=2903797 RepID=UPI002E12007F|nr:HAMP domain-containing histidine kinase [Streptomyces sp. NBC_01244]